MWSFSIRVCVLIPFLLLFQVTAFAGTKVSIETSMGSINLELADDKAPQTVANFLKYVDSGFYSQTVFHRVINNFMIQGGGFTEDLSKKRTRPSIKLEAPGKTGLSNTRGTVAMARLPTLHSATSQFFINVSDNRNLDSHGGGYAVFGRVTSGMDVVDRIKAVPTTIKSGMRDVPKNHVIIKRIYRIE